MHPDLPRKPAAALVLCGSRLVAPFSATLPAQLNAPKKEGTAVNWGAFNERHRLIMLVFFGELAFAAATPDAIALTVCCLFAGLGLFLHYVMAWPAGVTLPFEISRLRMVAHIHVHFFLMVFIPVLGAAFTRMIEEANERRGGGGGEGGEAGGGKEGDAGAATCRSCCVPNTVGGGCGWFVGCGDAAPANVTAVCVAANLGDTPDAEPAEEGILAMDEIHKACVTEQMLFSAVAVFLLCIAALDALAARVRGSCQEPRLLYSLSPHSPHLPLSPISPLSLPRFLLPARRRG